MQNTIKFTEPLSSCLEEDKYCIVTIQVKEEEYDDNTWYYISYTYQYGSHIASEKCHPFYYDRKFYNEHSKGDILLKNHISISLINGLMQQESTLNTGRTTYQQYIKQIMKCVAILYD